MRNTILSLSLIVIVSTLIGCASHTYSILQPLEKPLSAYSVLEVAKVKNNLNAAGSEELSAGLPERIVGELQEYQKEHPNRPFFRTVVTDTAATDDVLRMQTTLITYEKGSRAKRYLLGPGLGGKAYTTVQCDFIDKAENEVILRANFEGEISGGVFGGSAKQSSNAVVKSIVDYLRKNY